MRSLRWLFPASIFGVWAGVLAHTYMASLAGTLHAWQPNGVFPIVTSVAAGAGMFLVTRLIVDKPEPRLPDARVPTWMPRLGFRTLAVAAVISTLVQIERAERTMPSPPEVSSMDEPTDLEVEEAPRPGTDSCTLPFGLR